MSFGPPKGTNDLLAPESQAWRGALSVWDDWSSRFGYPLVSTPIFEATELFQRGVGQTSEVVTKQMYTFVDKGGRSVTLRPEGTAGVVRAFLNSGHQGAWKGAYSGPFFRYERPQKGRGRQFWQVGVEYLNVESPVADAEVIELGYRYLSALDVTGLELLVNSIGDPKCRPGYVDALRTYLEERRDLLGEDSVRLIEPNPLRVLDSKVDRPKLVDIPSIIDFLCEECAEHYASVRTMLETLEIPYTEDSSLVRGLDYYTRTAFEYVAQGLDASQNAVGGGGRYDGLAEAIGGSPTPGVGFALGLDRIVLARGGHPPSLLDAYLVSEIGPEAALAAASQLRSRGVRVEFDGQGRSVKAQFRTASRLEVPVILVYKGSDQLDVQTTEERVTLALDDVPAWLEARS